MTYSNEIKTPYRWYDRQERLIKHLSYCKGTCRYKLLTPPDRFLPFMLIRDASQLPVLSWNIYDSDDNLITSISPSNLEKKTLNGYDYLIYYGNQIEFLWLDCGYYRAEISDGENTFYSEEFFTFPSSEVDIFFGAGYSGTNWVFEIVNGEQHWNAISGNTNSLTFSTPGGLAGQNIVIDLTISNFTAGSLSVDIGGTAYSFYANGTYKISLVASTDFIEITFIRDALFDGTLWIRGFDQSYYDLDCYTILAWTNSCDVDNIYYRGGFTNYLYLDQEADVGRPADKLTEEGKENGERVFIPTFQKMQIIQTLQTGLIPNYVLESLFLLRMHDNIICQQPNGRGELVLKEPVIEADFQFEETCYADSIIKFVVQEIIKTGCCAVLSECDNPELVRNGAFDLGGNSWNFAGNSALGGCSYSSGKVVMNTAVDGKGFSQQIIGTTALRWYEIKFDIIVNIGSFYVTFCASDDRTGGNTSDAITTSGSKTILLPATDNGGGDLYVHIWGEGEPAVGSIDNISISERCFQPPSMVEPEGEDVYCLYRGELCGLYDIPSGTVWTGLIMNDGDTETYSPVALLNTAALITALEGFFGADSTTIEWDGDCIVIWVVATENWFNGTTDGIVLTKYQPAAADHTVVMVPQFCA